MKILMLLCLLVMPACVSLNAKPAPGIGEAKSMGISVKCSRESFQQEIEAWLKERGVSITVAAEKLGKGWFFECAGSHSWDISFFLSDAKITAFLDGAEVGHSKFGVSGGMMSLDPNKYRTDKTTVGRMLSALYGIKPPEAPKLDEDDEFDW